MDPTELRLQRINAKGMEVATKLSELLAGKEVSFADLELGGPGGRLLAREKKEARLRNFLATINGARSRLQAGGDVYGRCIACSVPLADPLLDERPWVEVCDPCFKAGAAYSS